MAALMCRAHTPCGVGNQPRRMSRRSASVITSDEPIAVQHTRLDSRQAENALLSAIAYSER
ncbi:MULTISPECIES: sensory rhodopsin transducer [Phyllobacteriaceae]|uniref:sensory rhodopsin transducer n=1 Tax=Phyllobacteriaceae TaxID=69277 RepID=UPI002ACAFF1C|nr:sensory rhodopsin transducer [Chelativorans sp. M5D2P16]MDZ5699437.1 sensory rhodopsin transducer [Chelativorans sp. M5D2P16]